MLWEVHMRIMAVLLCVGCAMACGATPIAKSRVQEPSRQAKLTSAVDALVRFETERLCPTDIRIAAELVDMTVRIQNETPTVSTLTDCLLRSMVLLDELFRMQEESLSYFSSVSLIVRSMMFTPKQAEEVFLKAEVKRVLVAYGVKSVPDSLEDMVRLTHLNARMRQAHVDVWAKDRIELQRSIENLHDVMRRQSPHPKYVY